jgi:hypothetical protein
MQYILLCSKTTMVMQRRLSYVCAYISCLVQFSSFVRIVNSVRLNVQDLRRSRLR